MGPAMNRQLISVYHAARRGGVLRSPGRERFCTRSPTGVRTLNQKEVKKEVLRTTDLHFMNFFLVRDDSETCGFCMC